VGQAFLNTLTAGRQEDCLVRQLFNAVSSFENRMQVYTSNGCCDDSRSSWFYLEYGGKCGCIEEGSGSTGNNDRGMDQLIYCKLHRSYT
jgi:hypothetical protein